MSVRVNPHQIVRSAALELLRDRVSDRAVKTDILLLGERCEACSPLPQRLNIDFGGAVEYNPQNVDMPLYRGEPLFKSVRVGGAYVDFCLSDRAYELFCDDVLAEYADIGVLPQAIRVGCYAEYAYAKLLDVVYTAYDGNFVLESEAARRGLWLCFSLVDAKDERMLKKRTDAATRSCLEAVGYGLASSCGTRRVCLKAARTMAALMYMAIKNNSDGEYKL